MSRPRILLDTNLVISAALFASGAPRRAFAWAVVNGVVLLTDALQTELNEENHRLKPASGERNRLKPVGVRRGRVRFNAASPISRCVSTSGLRYWTTAAG